MTAVIPDARRLRRTAHDACAGIHRSVWADTSVRARQRSLEHQSGASTSRRRAQAGRRAAFGGDVTRAACADQVVEFYNRGGDFREHNVLNIDFEIGKLNLTRQQIDDLVAFSADR
jgi:hypothetical protein